MANLSKTTFQIPLTDFLILPAIIATFITKDGSEAFQTAIPMTFAIWIAIRQRNIKKLHIINPFTSGMMAGLISYPLVVLANTNNQPIEPIALFNSCIKGGAIGLFYGFMAIIYVAIALAIWESVIKRKHVKPH